MVTHLVAQEFVGGRTLTILDTLMITELIARAPWREAVTYRNTWPHEYVLSRKDGQRELIEAVRARFRAGEGVAGSFFGRLNTYLFIGDHKYWRGAPTPTRRSRGARPLRRPVAGCRA